MPAASSADVTRSQLVNVLRFLQQSLDSQHKADKLSKPKVRLE